MRLIDENMLENKFFYFSMAIWGWFLNLSKINWIKSLKLSQNYLIIRWKIVKNSNFKLTEIEKYFAKNHAQNLQNF